MSEAASNGISPEKASPFEQQFDAGKRELYVLGGTVDFRILTPETVTDSVPVVLAPGYGETQEVFKRSAETVFNFGRPVIILDHPRRASVFDKETLSQVGEENDMPIHELRKAATLLHIFDEEGIEKADAIVHSEAAINVALAEALAPGTFRDVVLSNPAGLIGPDKKLRLLRRSARKDARNILQTIKGKIGVKTEVKALIEGLKYIVSNLNRSFGEVREISQTELEDTLRDLHDQGMGIAVMAGVDDRTFTMDRMQKVVRSDQVPGGFVDGFASVLGGHDDLHQNPDQYTGAALVLLTSLNEKRRQAREAAAETPPEGIWDTLKAKRSEKTKGRFRRADRRELTAELNRLREGRDNEIVDALKESAQQAKQLRTDEDLRRNYEANILADRQAQRDHEAENMAHLDRLTAEFEKQRREIAEQKREEKEKENKIQDFKNEVKAKEASIGARLGHPVLTTKAMLEGRKEIKESGKAPTNLDFLAVENQRRTENRIPPPKWGWENVEVDNEPS